MTTIKIIITCAAAVILATAVFAHMWLPAVEPEVAEAKTKLKKVEAIIDQANSQIVDLSHKLNAKKISSEDFNMQLKSIITIIEVNQNKISSLKLNYQNTKENNRVLGFSSWHKFSWAIGISLVAFILAITTMLNALNERQRNLRYAKIFYGLMGGISGGYMMAWVFIDLLIPDSKDFSLKTYQVVWIISGFAAFLFTVFISKWLLSQLDSTKILKKEIGRLIALIGKIRVHHFLKMAIKLETPQNSKIIDHYIEDFDKQTSETIRKVSNEI